MAHVARALTIWLFLCVRASGVSIPAMVDGTLLRLRGGATAAPPLEEGMGGDENGGAYPLTGIDFVYQEKRWRQGIEERTAKRRNTGQPKTRPEPEAYSFEPAPIPDDAEKTSLRIRAHLDRRQMNAIVRGTRRYAACVRLWAAAYFGLTDEILAALHDGAVVDYPDFRSFETFGFTALHWAAFRDDVEAIEVLVQCGATIDLPTHDEDTPMHVAASQGHTAAVKTLIRLQASLDMPDSKMLTPMERACVLGHYDTAEVIADAEHERAQVELEEKLLALGKRMSSQWSRAKAGLPKDEIEAKAIDQTGRWLAKELAEVQKWKATKEEGGDGREVKREETVEEFEEKRVREEAELLLERGLAFTFQEAVTLVMRNREAMGRLRELHADLGSMDQSDPDGGGDDDDEMTDPHQELSQTQLPTEDEIKAISKSEAVERMEEYREHLAMMCERYPAVKAMERLTVNPYNESAKRILYEERYKGNVPEKFEELCLEVFGRNRDPDDDEDEDEERDPFAPPSEESQRDSDPEPANPGPAARKPAQQDAPTATGEDDPGASRGEQGTGMSEDEPEDGGDPESQ